MATVHTYPVNDLVEHDTDGGDCVCGPTTEPVPRGDGSFGWHVLHHSLDGRERFERPASHSEDGAWVDDDEVSHVTPSNPSGTVSQCNRTYIHDPHEYQEEFGSYFNVYCPGNDGKRKDV